ncbi:hypothetical protein ACYTPF_13810 [Alteromonas sp. HB246098]
MLPSTTSAASMLEVNRVVVREDDSLPFTLGDKTLAEDMLLVQVDVGLDEAFVINIESTPKMPIRLPYQALLHAINEGGLDVVDMAWDDKVMRAFDQLTQNEQARAQSRYALIASLIDDLEAVIRNSHGDGAFQRVIEQSGRSKQYVYDCFCGYLFYGQRRTALALPIGKNIFHKAKASRDIRVKQGRPNQFVARGKILDEHDFKAFAWALKKYQSRNGPSLERVFLDMQGKFYFASRTRTATGVATTNNSRFHVELKPRTERPTIAQFTYWVKKQCGGNLPKRDRRRRNPIEHSKDLAGRTGDAFGTDDGFGKTFELDETPFDEEAVSQFDETRQTKIGKPTFYFVVDRFSRYITGLYITTEAPSFKTVRQAVFNAAINKAKFLEEYGFEPGEVKWEFHGIPTTLFVDNAEFRNRKSEAAVSDLAMKVQFARRGRGDDKPHVEQLFRVFALWFKGLSKGQQSKSLADIAAQLARKHASLNLTELYIIAIIYINYHNNHRRLKDYQYCKEMLMDDVAPIPAKLCEWGQRYRPGHTMKYDERDLYRALLPVAVVSVHQRGIYFADVGLWYNCEYVLESGLQDKLVSRNRVVKLRARYNENLVDVIFLETDNGLKPATLDVRCQAFQGLSCYEATLQRKSMARDDELAKDDEIEFALGVSQAMQRILKNAQKEKQPGVMPTTATLKDNRKLEAILNRYADINKFLAAVQLDHVQIEPNALPEKPDGKNIYDEFEEDDDA